MCTETGMWASRASVADSGNHSLPGRSKGSCEDSIHRVRTLRGGHGVFRDTALLAKRRRKVRQLVVPRTLKKKKKSQNIRAREEPLSTDGETEAWSKERLCRGHTGRKEAEPSCTLGSTPCPWLWAALEMPQVAKTLGVGLRKAPSQTSLPALCRK